MNHPSRLNPSTIPQEVNDAANIETSRLASVYAVDIQRHRTALERIAKWFGEFPPSGHQWEDGRLMTYGAAYGSNGERDYMRSIATTALK